MKKCKNDRPNIFISYCQKDIHIIERFEEDLMPANLKLIRDNRDIKFLGSIKEFMNLVKTSDFVILFISDNYFKSTYCMREVMNLFSSTNFVERMIIIKADEHKVHSGSGGIEYLKYWENKITSLNNEIKELGSLANTNTIVQEINYLTDIRNECGKFFDVIIDKNIYDLSKLRAASYTELFNFIGVDNTSLYKDIVYAQTLSGEM